LDATISVAAFTTLATVKGYMDSVAKEAIEIQLPPKKFNGFVLSKTLQFLLLHLPTTAKHIEGQTQQSPDPAH
jgi:hypothetical protein